MNMCQPGTIAYSQKMVITDSTACEVPFVSIANNLKNNVIPTIITETSFKDWGNDQSLDNVKATAGFGAGDKEDLENEMDSTQQCTGALGKPNPVDIGITGLREMQISTYAKQPVTMSIFSETTDFLPISAHAVIVLKVTEGANKNFKIRVLDSGTQAQPDYPKAYDIDCNPGTIRVNEVYAPTIVCVHPEMGRVWFINDEISVVRGLKQAFLGYCRNNSFSKFCTERKDMTGWLEANYPKIQNFVGPNGGVCSGWSVFILRVAYLGDFVGTDYHSNDGKIVGRDCDANHYPSQKSTSIKSQNWLANAWSAWQGFLK
jgi:hypothetical protein